MAGKEDLIFSNVMEYENSENLSSSSVPLYILSENDGNTSMTEFDDPANLLNTSVTSTDIQFNFSKQFQLDVLISRGLRHSFSWNFVLMTAFALIFFGGIMGNCSILFVVFKKQQMQSVANLFVCNLAVADLFVLVFYVPATLLANLLQPWVFGSVMCKGIAYIQGVSVSASAYSLVAISVDRCKAVCLPTSHTKGFSKTQAICLICLIWIFSFVLMLPWAVVFDVVNEDGYNNCQETWTNNETEIIYFFVANLFCGYIIPVVIILVSNIKILCYVTHREIPQDSASPQAILEMHKKARYGVLKMLGIITLAFFLSWFPLNALVTFFKLNSTKKFSILRKYDTKILSFLNAFSQWLGGCNSFLNPLLYAYFNRKFRANFNNVLLSGLSFIKRKKFVKLEYH